MSDQTIVWLIAVASIAAVILRPFGWPEAIWALFGAAALVLLRLVSLETAWTGVLKGSDVYMFLAGMMLLSEAARREGLFDWLAGHAIRAAKGSQIRLFTIVYIVGVFVTAFLSNDATAVVLTPAVYAATSAAGIRKPMPYLLICAFIANAASFVLPISNPANLVVFGGGHMPALVDWLKIFGLPSAVSIALTFGALFFILRADLREKIECPGGGAVLSSGGKITGIGIICTCLALICASAIRIDLGGPTLAAGIATTALVVAVKKENPLLFARDVSWSVLPLVAGLFVLVEALDGAGLVSALKSWLDVSVAKTQLAAPIAGGMVAVATNLVNNLPAGLVSANVVQQSSPPLPVVGAILIGVDLGPNLSVTGSLATILWLSALRREGQTMSAWKFLKIGLVVMPTALVPALAALASIAN